MPNTIKQPKRCRYRFPFTFHIAPVSCCSLTLSCSYSAVSIFWLSLVYPHQEVLPWPQKQPVQLSERASEWASEWASKRIRERERERPKPEHSMHHSQSCHWIVSVVFRHLEIQETLHQNLTFVPKLSLFPSGHRWCKETYFMVPVSVLEAIQNVQYYLNEL